MPVRFARLVACWVLVSTSIGAPSHAEDMPDQGRPVSSHVARAGPKADSEHQTGNASFYAHRFRGRKTASGQLYDPEALTAAHRSLPMGTKLQITNPKNDRSVVVTVNDRGRLPKGRVVDLSSAAADALDMKRSGVTKVETRIVGKTGQLQPEARSDPPRDTRPDAVDAEPEAAPPR